jgi:hypothetical protein
VLQLRALHLQLQEGAVEPIGDLLELVAVSGDFVPALEEFFGTEPGLSRPRSRG